MFAIQIASNALFYHTHSIDGKMYSHAHPGGDGHSHNSVDFTFYEQLQNNILEELTSLLSDPYLVFIQELNIYDYKHYYSVAHTSNVGRAPPVM